MFAPKRILVPTDFSDYSDDALKQAIELAKQYHSKLYLLHVAQPMNEWLVDYPIDLSAIREAEKDEILRAKEKMQMELAKFPDTQGIEVISDIREGDPFEEILKEQEENGVDLIVIPSHGKSGLLKRLMGPISEKIMEEAKSPVLVVRH